MDGKEGRPGGLDSSLGYPSQARAWIISSLERQQEGITRLVQREGQEIAKKEPALFTPMNVR